MVPHIPIDTASAVEAQAPTQDLQYGYTSVLV